MAKALFVSQLIFLGTMSIHELSLAFNLLQRISLMLVTLGFFLLLLSFRDLNLLTPNLVLVFPHFKNLNYVLGGLIVIMKYFIIRVMK